MGVTIKLMPRISLVKAEGCTAEEAYPAALRRTSGSVLKSLRNHIDAGSAA